MICSSDQNAGKALPRGQSDQESPRQPASNVNKRGEPCMRSPLTLRSLKVHEKSFEQLVALSKALYAQGLSPQQAEEFDRLSTNFHRLISARAGIELEFPCPEEEQRVLQEVDSWDLILHRTQLKDDALLSLFFTFHSKYLPLRAISSLENPTKKEAS